jgi:hypothetical protein
MKSFLSMELWKSAASTVEKLWAKSKSFRESSTLQFDANFFKDSGTRRRARPLRGDTKPRAAEALRCTAEGRRRLLHKARASALRDGVVPSGHRASSTSNKSNKNYGKYCIRAQYPKYIGAYDNNSFND